MALALRRLKDTNRCLNDLEALTGRAEIHSIPPHIEVDFSIRCNFRCVMCHQSKLKFEPTELMSNEVNAVIEILPYVDTVLVAGLGEPLLVPALDHFLEYASLFGCHLAMFTNGELIDRRIEVFRHLRTVNVSFDGGTAATFEHLRSGADFEHIVRNLKLLRSRYPNLEINFSTVLSHPNVPEVERIVAIAAQVGANNVNISPVNHTPHLDLRVSDWDKFLTGVERGRPIAASAGLNINVNVAKEHFTAPDDRPAFRILADPLPKAVRDAVPEAYVRSQKNARWGGVLQVPYEVVARRALEATARLERYIVAIETELRDKHTRALPLPYCTAPWKALFAQNDGRARLCPYAAHAVGAIADGVLAEPNTPELLRIRGSLAQNAPVLDVCRTCIDDHRQFRIETMRETSESLGIAIGPRLPAAHDRQR